MDYGWREVHGYTPDKIEFDGTSFVYISEEGVRSDQENVIRFAEEIEDYRANPSKWTGTPFLDLSPWDALIKEVADAGAGAGACSLFCMPEARF
jgi:hypothetical protein